VSRIFSLLMNILTNPCIIKAQLDHDLKSNFFLIIYIIYDKKLIIIGFLTSITID